MVARTLLGSMHSESLARDPKHLLFSLARYHFVARMLHGHARVLEVGCGDGTGAQVVRAAVRELCGVDADIGMVTQAARVMHHAYQHDMTRGPFRDGAGFSAAYALDVLEHIDAAEEDYFIENIVASTVADAPLIIGSPSLESQPYASAPPGDHVNCKTEDGLRELLQRHYCNVFLFGMSDATLHAGFGPMCHYRLAIAI